MVLALIAIALAMVATGVIAIGTGADMIVLERGWSAVIAGSVIATGGALLVGLALIVRELQHLPHRLETVPGDEAVADEGASTGTLAAAAEPALSAETIHSVEPPTAATSVPDLPSVALAESEPTPAREAASRPILEAAPRRRPILEARRDARRMADTDIAPPVFAEQREPAEDPVASAAGPAETMRSVFPDFSPRDRIAPREAEPVASPIEDAKPIDTTPVEETQVDAESKTGPSTDPPEVIIAPQPEPEPKAPEESNDGATVVGTYSSGGNVYVMYANGSIEADTPDGVFRFNSLDELKAYIASTGNGEEPGKRQASSII